jgi:membrane protease YdiL (CAAX protease family)
LIILALIPAVTEELFFRGMLQNLLKEKVSVHVAIWISAIIFSAFHMQFYGFIPRMLLGGLLGYFLLWSESLILPIIAHFTNNAIMIIAYFFIQKNHLPINMDNLGTNQQQWVGLFSLVPLFATLYFMHLKYLSMKKNYNHKEL